MHILKVITLNKNNRTFTLVQRRKHLRSIFLIRKENAMQNITTFINILPGVYMTLSPM